MFVLVSRGMWAFKFKVMHREVRQRKKNERINKFEKYERLCWDILLCESAMEMKLQHFESFSANAINGTKFIWCTFHAIITLMVIFCLHFFPSIFDFALIHIVGDKCRQQQFETHSNVSNKFQHRTHTHINQYMWTHNQIACKFYA